MSIRERTPRRTRDPRPRSSRWNDLVIGVRMSMVGGRENVTRTLLTAVGVGVATAMLLLAASLPTILDNRSERAADRVVLASAEHPPPTAGDDTLLIGSALANGDHQGTPIEGWMVEPEGPDAPLPPGVEELPAPGEMLVSPALAELLDDPEHDLLRQRLDHPVAGHISQEGLTGPHELLYYLGGEDMEVDKAGAVRLDTFEGGEPWSADDPLIMLLGVVGTAVMLTPVLVFLSAAVRTGGEQRDRRLAALRLMGADQSATRRITAGETLGGALAGVVLGGVFFLLGRPLVETVPIATGVFASDVVPLPVLGALVVVAVPVLALWVALMAVRGVVVEPLGVVRRAERGKPRLWWRLLLPMLGIALIHAALDPYHVVLSDAWPLLVSLGVLAVLSGGTAVLPWLMDRTVRAMPGSPLSLRLAARRPAVGDGGPARAVNGIVVTVAGAIALLSLLNGVEKEQEAVVDERPPVAGAEQELYLRVGLPSGPVVDDPAAVFEEQPAIDEALITERMHTTDDSDRGVLVHIADCDTLQRTTDLNDCAPGYAFATSDTSVPPGTLLQASIDGDPLPWTVPEYTELPGDVPGLEGDREDGLILATPEAAEAAGADALEGVSTTALLRVDEDVPDVREQVFAAAATVDPTARVGLFDAPAQAGPLDNMKNMLLAGAVACLVMVMAGLLVGTVEQVRERRRVHAVLTAFGARRRTLVASLAWQTALPVLLGITCAAVFGFALGALLLWTSELPVTFVPGDVLIVVVTGAGAVLLATLGALPALLRTMRPDGLRSE